MLNINCQVPLLRALHFQCQVYLETLIIPQLNSKTNRKKRKRSGNSSFSSGDRIQGSAVGNSMLSAASVTLQLYS